MANTSQDSRLQCGIVGAGIAGLAAAIALIHAGHDVEVFEKSSFNNELGAAIGIQPNGSYILRRWGFDFDAAHATSINRLRSVDGVTGKVTKITNFEDNRARYGSDLMSFHRVDLHSQLRALAVAAGARLQLGTPIADVDVDDGVIKFQDGNSTKKDLVVIASGIHNTWIEKVTGEERPVKTIGILYRLLVPMDKVLADEKAAPLFKDQEDTITEAWGNDTLFFAYPCRKASLLNIVVARREAPIDIDVRPDSWNLSGSKEEALNLVSGCDPAFASIVQYAERVNRYASSFRTPVPHMHRGKVVLIGDAAHAMSPALGQGANMAVEDAAALEALFSDWGSSNHRVEDRLGLFNELRNPRTSVVQHISNGLLFLASPEKLSAEAATFYPDLPAYPADGDHFTPSSRQYIYRHNVFKEAAKISRYNRAEEVPKGSLSYFQEGVLS